MNSYNGFNARSTALAFVFSVMISITLIAAAGVPDAAIAAPLSPVTQSA